MEDEPLNIPDALIIDDEVDICYLLKGILKLRNIRAAYVTSLSDADQALLSYPTAPPLIFLDNHLADGLGIEYIRRIKDRSPETIVVMITAHDTASDRQKAFEEGVDFFIGKPFTRDAILQTVDKINP